MPSQIHDESNIYAQARIILRRKGSSGPNTWKGSIATGLNYTPSVIASMGELLNELISLVLGRTDGERLYMSRAGSLALV